ncbi:MAG: AAA family ATPase [Cyanobacteria bacterium P01_F01_bin.150]
MNLSSDQLFIQDVTQFLGYAPTEALYKGPKISVYRALEISSGRSVVIKYLKQDYPSFGELVQFRNQYTITKDLPISGIVKPLKLKAFGNSYVLVMEDMGGISLKDYVRRYLPDIAEVLSIAIQLATILHDLHHHRIIHKDIKPANILIHPGSKQVKLIDFSIASLLPKEIQAIQCPGELEGSLAYLAPEQTGRMNRAIDYRTDFYALGVTLYELLTGQLPFESNDSMELIHCHIAQHPVAIEQINPEVPAMVAAIAHKLMAKNAEDRYQSALGLKYDLEQCLTQEQNPTTLTEFILGQRDLSDRFIIPQKLYGRESEVQTLLKAFDQVAAGASELMLISGFSGIGKTAVVNEVHKPITQKKGYFIKGKFDQFNRNIPLSAFIQAFQDLVEQLLSSNDIELRYWQEKILIALGENAQVIIDLIPNLEKILGLQPPVPELSGLSAQNRFNLLFQKFIQVFTTPEHPLVIFIDDLQWADSASLNLIQVLMADAQLGYLLLVGAYRDNEVFPAHPFMLTLDELEKLEVPIHSIALQPLEKKSLNQLIADTLHTQLQTAQPLTELVIQKTQGNPFFVTQFLKALHQEQLITFDDSNRHWQCDIAKVQEMALTEDVVEFMALQLQKLPAVTQQLLKRAACIGAQFDLATLAIISECSQSDVAAALWHALQEGIIFPKSKLYKFYWGGTNTSQEAYQESEVLSYKFSHDRVQQAAYSLITIEQRKETHWHIGQLLLAHTNTAQQDPKIFDIVNQLNYGISSQISPEEQESLAILNLQAGQKAKLATAYVSAYKYLKQGCTLLQPDCWKSQYQLAVELHIGAAEAASLNTDFKSMKASADQTLDHINNIQDRVRVYELLILYHHTQSHFREAVDLAISILSELGEAFPANPDTDSLMDALNTTTQLIRLKGIENLNCLPSMDAPEKIAAMRVLRYACYPAYFAYQEMLGLIVCRLVDLTLKYGHSPLTPFAYGIFSVLMNGGVGDIALGKQFGELAIELEHQQDTLQYRALTYNSCYGLSRHFYKPVRECLDPLIQGYESFADNGDAESSSYCLINAYFCTILSGINLETIQKQFEKYIQHVVTFKHEQVINQLYIWTQVLNNLRGKGEYTKELKGQSFDIDNMLPKLYETNNLNTINYAHTAQAMLAYTFNDSEKALKHTQTTKPWLGNSTGKFFISIHNFYNSLSLIAMYPEVDDLEKEDYLENICQNQHQLEQWAEHCPTNFEHKFLLIEAELSRITEINLTTIDFYDRAISNAKENGFLHEEALANELAAKCCLEWGKERFATSYMQEAYYCYSRWGAEAKVDDLETRYPHLLRPILERTEASMGVLNTLMTVAPSTVSIHARGRKRLNTTNRINDTLDFASVLKASQALSSAIQLDELLCQLTQIILQNSGGDRCALILPDESGEWLVKAIVEHVHQFSPDPEDTPLYTTPLHNHPNLPVKLIQYVKNTLEGVVIDDLDTDLPVVDDYLRQQQPRSLLCLPILNQGKLIGILYLQNQLTNGVFTEDRLLVLNFLCTQAAISLENARWYQQEQKKSQEIAQKESEYRSIFENVNDGLMLVNLKTGQIVAVNPRMCQMHGHTTQEFLALQPSDFIHANYVDEFTHFLDVLNQGEEFYTQSVALRKDGHSFDAEVKAVPLMYRGHPHGLAVIRDISARQKAENALRKSEAKFRNLLSNLDEVVYRCQNDEAWTMEFISDSITDLSGYPATDFIGNQKRAYATIIHPDDIGWVEEAVANRLEQQQMFALEYRIIHRGGSIRWVTEKGKGVCNDAGELSHIEGVIIDISDRKKAEESVLQKSRDLEQALTDLQQAQLQLVQNEKMSALGGLISGVAHEINNPVGCILGNVGATQDYINDLLGLLDLYANQYPEPGSDIEDELDAVDLEYVREDLPELMRAMKDSGDRIKSISTSLRTFSRADRDTKQAFDLREGIDSTVLILRHRLKANDQRPAIKVVTNYGNIPDVNCFPGQLNQVFMNILANAIDALDEVSQSRNFDEMKANPPRIMLRTSMENDQVKIAIADNGAGMSEEIKTRIFDHLFTTKQVGKGTGLGLAIARQIVVEKHGGTLAVHSEVGLGTEFLIRLPIH